MNRVKGKTAIVTGGASGIGHAACALLGQEGAAIAVTDVVDDESLLYLWTRRGRPCAGVPCR
jgi:NAD(P)-dependent dehydrogenase (short-subunit alcohol dehydrogenase family)